MIEFSVYMADVVFRVPRRVRLTAWSGVYAGKIVYDSLGLAGTPLPEGGLFRVTPIYPARGGTIPVSGFLAPGEKYRFQAVFWGHPPEAPAEVLARGFTIGATMNNNILLDNLQLREEKLKAPPPTPQEDEDNGDTKPVAATITLRHGPTFYRFHGAIVSYPSPWRLVASAARRLSTATGLDYRPLAARLQPYLELALDNTKKTRIRLSHRKEVRVFIGEARYHAVGSKHLLEQLTKLLQLAKILGVGGSPGLGLGEINHIEIKPPKHILPQPVEPWAEEANSQ